MGSKARIERRLSSYWKLEAGNVLLIPAFVLFITAGNMGLATLLALVPVMGLLAIGAAYWRAKHLQIIQGTSPDRVVRIVARWRSTMLAATVVACAAAIWGHVAGVGFASRVDLWAATVLAVLAALEYANYYWRQLQHFDHADDFQRLLAGRGFRKSQLRQDMERLGLI